MPFPQVIGGVIVNGLAKGGELNILLPSEILILLNMRRPQKKKDQEKKPNSLIFRINIFQLNATN